MDKLFLNEIEPRDQTYRFIRDNPDGADAKVFVEHLWDFFSPFADRNFQSAIASSFHTRFWEMYLAFGLLMQGAKLQATSSTGPDLLLSGLPHPVWVEAIVPSRGTGPDQVPGMHLVHLDTEQDIPVEDLIGSYQNIPSEELILRYRAAIEEKFRKLHGYLERDVVKNSDPYVIAINSRALPFGIYEPSIPRILQALFPLGNLVATLQRTTKGWVAPIGYSYRDKIAKRSGCPVSTNVFIDPMYERITAIIFCPSDVWHRPPNDAEVGLDFLLIHNPVAKNKVPHQWLKCGRECWVEDDHLVIKNWYKEHPSFAKETEPEVTLEDHIQKHKARRRMKHGDVPKGGDPI